MSLPAITKRLDRLAEVLIENPAYSKYCHTIYEASAEIERLTAELAAAKAQLPAEMQDCTILFKECDKGHGWLTATNWIQHPCPTCKLEAAKAEHYEECAAIAKSCDFGVTKNFVADAIRAALTDTKE